jgi:hypothetical protein
MRHIPALFSLLLILAGASAALAQEDPRVETTRALTKKAQEAMKRGDSTTARAYMAESLALWADILWDKGERKEAERRFFQAREMGWDGAPPWQGERAVPPPPVEPKQEERIPVPKPEPIRKPVRKPSAAAGEYWDHVFLSPPASSRNGVWHGLLGIPPFEEASTLPPELWLARGRWEMNAGDFEKDAEGGISQWKAVMSEQSLQVDYGLFDEFQVGMRLSIGELMETDDTPIRIFQDTNQIVPSGRRHWAPSEITLRAKYAHRFSGFSLGALTEVKISIADEEDLISSGTLDLGFVGLFTYRSGKFAVHANVGAVVPTGSADLFTPEEDPNPFFIFSAGVSYQLSAPLVAMAMIDANTSGWSDITVLDETVIGGSLAMRWRITDALVLGVGIRMGFNELSGDAGGFGSLEISF